MSSTSLNKTYVQEFTVVGPMEMEGPMAVI